MSASRLRAPLGMLVFAPALAAGAGIPMDWIPDEPHPAYTLTRVGLPVAVRSTGMAFLPDSSLLLLGMGEPWGGRIPEPQGEAVLYRVRNLRADSAQRRMEVLADFWREPVGLVLAEGKAYVSDRDGFYEVESLERPIADPKANRRKVLDWPLAVSSHPDIAARGAGWHQYVFTPQYRDGKFYAPHSGNIATQGWSTAPAMTEMTGGFLRWDLEGNLEALAGGLRSPNGAGMDELGNVFVTDNQGSFVPGSPLMRMRPGRFYGHRQVGYDPNWAEGLPYDPPVAWMPYLWKHSASQPLRLREGPYAGDWVVGDMNGNGLARVALDPVGSELQGSAFPFSHGYGSAAVNRLALSPDGGLYLGTFGHNSNWGHGRPGSLWRMDLVDGAEPFDLRSIRSVKGGLELKFTGAVRTADLTPEKFAVSQRLMRRDSVYGCCQGDSVSKSVSALAVSEDGRRVFLQVEGLEAGDQMTLVKSQVASELGEAPWNAFGWITLNYPPVREWDPESETDTSLAVRKSGRRLSRGSTLRIGEGWAFVSPRNGEVSLQAFDAAGRRIWGLRRWARAGERMVLPASADGAKALWLRASWQSDAPVANWRSEVHRMLPR